MLPLLKRKARVLLLDDDHAMQRLIAKLLQRQGYRVDVVSAASPAIEKIGSTDYDALLLDLMTPTEGGMTVIRHLKKVKPAMLSRVLLVTASPDAVLRAVAPDVAGVVQKPFEAKELLEAVERIAAK
ncbi:MAG TPA: response regulator [Thermoanaerobaculia bacterium]|nr:response regulator [Thermoanaerobaculia bacterium]